MNFDDFDEWFKQATGHPPFPYQRKLATSGEWPELLEIPTGAGKTAAAVLSWLWRRRFHPDASIRQDTPRRLVYCLPMRVLVEQTRACAVRWLHKLGLLAGEAEFDGDRLKAYRVDWSDSAKIAVVTLMGGEVSDDWRGYPEREVIIVGTQDMLLSRALNRGYAMAPQQWPVDFGLLNMDTLWVMDEVQLMGPGRTTSVQLQLFWDGKPFAHLPRRTLWMSATLGTNTGTGPPQWMRTPEMPTRRSRDPHTLRHSPEDLDRPDFQACWSARKQLEVHLRDFPNSTPWTWESPELIREILNQAADGRLVIVFVNQVRRAYGLYQKIRQSAGPQGASQVLLVHGRMRPRDRRAFEARLQDSV
ncbi:MAG: DEAD/DEAH box helicase, partial [Acidobacteria bacterium]|nr:DEAD/DEAH box helicase [Acidobacteriota bacterium]MDW7985098.1 DEAD/DEAH box helicase [Acidobacteriota bacterium]